MEMENGSDILITSTSLLLSFDLAEKVQLPP